MKTMYVIAAIVIIVIIIGGVFAYTQLAQPAESPSASPTATPTNNPTNNPTMTPSPTSQAQVTLNGAGASFPYPLISSMISEYTHSVTTNVQINYQPIGSGGGISALIGKTVDFAGSDAPLKASEAEQAPNSLHIPETIGAVTVAYKLPEIETGLKLTGDIVAKIFLGEITTWNDQAIQSLNPDITLPSQDILVVHRSDGSGTTFIFTGYLTAVSSTWENDIGQAKTVEWPTGIGASGNTGVAAVVQGQDYSIGYVELAYALENEMTVAAIQNPAGNWILPTLDSTSKAAESAASMGLPTGDADWSSVNLLNAPGDEAYPIVSFSYIIVYKELNVIPGMTQDKASAVVQFLSYVINDGQQLASPLEYAPIPANVVQLNENTLSSITFNGTPVQ